MLNNAERSHLIFINPLLHLSYFYSDIIGLILKRLVGRLVVQRKTQNTYINVSEIIRKILQNRLEYIGGMQLAVELSERDPRRISRTIAQKSSPPMAEPRKNQDFNKQTFILL